MEAVSVVAAREGHLRDIPSIERAAAAIFSEADLPQHIRHLVTAAEDLRQAMDNGMLWAAVSGAGRVVGYAMADVVDGEGYLTEVDVLPDFGRQGTGTRLVGAVIDWARASGFRTLSLVTFRHLAWNAPFYEKLGFSIVSQPEPGSELAGLMKEERRMGIDPSKRVVMRLAL